MMGSNSNKDRDQKAEGRETVQRGKVSDGLYLDMAGAMMVERAQNLPSMAFTDPKEYLAR